MKKHFYFPLLLTVLLISLWGCTGTGNPKPATYLKNENADIFMLNDFVYTNAKHIDWVKEREYKIEDEIGEIKKQTDSAFAFTNGSANVLPVGTKIFSTDSPLTIAVVDGEEIPYIKQVEG